jgi:hypothetical protein
MKGSFGFYGSLAAVGVPVWQGVGRLAAGIGSAGPPIIQDARGSAYSPSPASQPPLTSRQDVASFGRVVEMQLDKPSNQLPQHRLNPPLNRRMVRAVTGDKLLDNGPQRRGRQ